MDDSSLPGYSNGNDLKHADHAGPPEHVEKPTRLLYTLADNLAPKDSDHVAVPRKAPTPKLGRFAAPLDRHVAAGSPSSGGLPSGDADALKAERNLLAEELMWARSMDERLRASLKEAQSDLEYTGRDLKPTALFLYRALRAETSKRLKRLEDLSRSLFFALSRMTDAVAAHISETTKDSSGGKSLDKLFESVASVIRPFAPMSKRCLRSWTELDITMQVTRHALGIGGNSAKEKSGRTVAKADVALMTRTALTPKAKNPPRMAYSLMKKNVEARLKPPLLSTGAKRAIAKGTSGGFENQDSADKDLHVHASHDKDPLENLHKGGSDARKHVKGIDAHDNDAVHVHEDPLQILHKGGRDTRKNVKNKNSIDSPKHVKSKHSHVKVDEHHEAGKVSADVHGRKWTGHVSQADDRVHKAAVKIQKTYRGNMARADIAFVKSVL